MESLLADACGGRVETLVRTLHWALYIDNYCEPRCNAENADTMLLRFRTIS